MRERNPAEPPRSSSPGLMLAGIFTAASVIIFLLGIWVGQDMARRHPDDGDVVVRRSAPPAPTAGAAPRPVEKAFFDEFREGMYDDLTAEDAPPASPAATTTAATKAETKVAATPTRPATKAPTAKPTATRKLPPTATRKVPPTATRTPVRRATPTTARAQDVKRGAWLVQVTVTRSESEALRAALELRSRGFQAATDRTTSGGITWFKVRLGPFASRQEAVAAYGRLQSTGKFNEAYVTTQ